MSVSVIKQQLRSNNGKANKIDSLQTVEEFRDLAEKKLPRMVYDYYASGSNAQITLADNVNAYSRIRLVPRCMVDVSQVNMQTEIFGHSLASPIIIAPTAMQRMAHKDGECATWNAAQAAGTIMTLSSLATTSVEELGKHSDGKPGWFQLYVFRDRAIAQRLVERAERAGFSAIMLTVDTPFLGNRLADYKNEFSLPAGLQMANFTDLPNSDIQGGLNQYVAKMIDSGLTWKDIKWLKSITRLPVLVKGIMCPEDAVLAVDNGVDGIIVSNHGARQLDTSPATVDVLPYIVKAVNNRVPVIMDGGIRCGTDVLKALAYGAKAVLIGRPVLWGLAAGGQEGVSKVLAILNRDLALAMALAGVESVAKIQPSMIWNPSNYSKL
eukprot:gene3898-4509_t